MSNWIEQFLDETEGLSPYPFRLWSGISAIASALQRKVFIITDKGTLYPNLYTMLSGSPGSGKTLMVNQVRELWKELGKFHVGPDNPTKASFMKAVMDARSTYMNGTGELHSQSAVAFGCREFGVMVPRHDIQFLSDLSDIFDNPGTYEAPRTSVDSYHLENPTINILAGVTPAHLYETFSDIAWNQGFTSRMIFVYSEEMPRRRGIFEKKRKEIRTSTLVPRLQQWSKHLVGESIFTDEAAEAAEVYCREEGMPPKPDHGRLSAYCSRRESALLKLSMIAAVSAGHGLSITLQDFECAKSWLLKTEERMPDVFHAMLDKSDAQLIRDLHHHCWNIYANVERQKRVPLEEEILWKFLRERTTSERITKVIEAALKSGVFVMNLERKFIPRSLEKFDLGGL